MKRKVSGKGSRSSTKAKGTTSKAKSAKTKKSNPVAMKHPPKNGGSVLEVEPADIEEFKHRKKLANKAAEPEVDDDDTDFSGEGFDYEDSEDRPEMYDEDGEMIR